MIGMDKLEDLQWYDGFIWYDGRQKYTITLQFKAEDALFKSNTDTRVYPHVAEPRVPRVYTFEPNIKGTDPDGKATPDTRTSKKAK